MDTSTNRAGDVALMVIGMIIALACASAIGAVTTLVVMAMDRPAPTQGGECGVVAWQTGIVHCFRSESNDASKQARHGPAVVVQAQAGPAR